MGDVDVFEYAAQGVVVGIELFLKNGGDVNTVNAGNDTLLHVIAKKGRVHRGHCEVVELLISKGANINARNSAGETPLYCAVQFNEGISIIEILISKGADIHICEYADSWTPLHRAAGRGNVDAAEVLIDNGAHLNDRTREGNTARDIAEKWGKAEMSRYLISVGAKRSTDCYIATAVYNSYEAPEVLTLRRFRDEVLTVSVFGRIFIALYYFFSPPIAKKLKNARRANAIVRGVLDKIVGRLDKQFQNQSKEPVS